MLSWAILAHSDSACLLNAAPGPVGDCPPSVAVALTSLIYADVDEDLDPGVEDLTEGDGTTRGVLEVVSMSPTSRSSCCGWTGQNLALGFIVSWSDCLQIQERRRRGRRRGRDARDAPSL